MTLLSSVLGDAAVTDALRVTLLMFRTEELLRHGCRRGKAERLGLSPKARIARTFFDGSFRRCGLAHGMCSVRGCQVHKSGVEPALTEPGTGTEVRVPTSSPSPRSPSLSFLATRKRGASDAECRACVSGRNCIWTKVARFTT